MEWLLDNWPLMEAPNEAIVARSDICGEITKDEFVSAMLSFTDEATALGIADDHTNTEAVFEALGIRDPDRTIANKIMELRAGGPKGAGSA